MLRIHVSHQPLSALETIEKITLVYLNPQTDFAADFHVTDVPYHPFLMFKVT